MNNFGSGCVSGERGKCLIFLGSLAHSSFLRAFSAFWRKPLLERKKSPLTTPETKWAGVLAPFSDGPVWVQDSGSTSWLLSAWRLGSEEAAGGRVEGNGCMVTRCLCCRPRPCLLLPALECPWYGPIFQAWPYSPCHSNFLSL